MFKHLQAHDHIGNLIQERKRLSGGEYLWCRRVRPPPGRRKVQCHVLRTRIKARTKPLVSGADIDNDTVASTHFMRNASAPYKPLRMKRRPAKQASQADSAAIHLTQSRLPLLYTSEVICSETSPMRKTMTEALKSRALMLVKRP